MTAYFCNPCNREHTLEEFGGVLCKDYIYYSCKDDLVTYGQFFLPGDFRRKFKSPPFHRVVGNRMISSEPGLHIALIAWRGATKSMLAKAPLLNHLGYRKPGGIFYVFFLFFFVDQPFFHIKYIP